MLAGYARFYQTLAEQSEKEDKRRSRGNGFNRRRP